MTAADPVVKVTLRINVPMVYSTYMVIPLTWLFERSPSLPLLPI